ncbi:MAG: hypothetical protein A2Y25_01180 [Candidatus Melainabacteria bacterium GWF2_37_15]|nr:MAG: hypothetical protein A2Y25_01180 [Candidatus Melainabacteria bacterium GWF2_37_15]
MNVSSARVDPHLLYEREYEFLNATSSFRRTESIFNQINTNFLSSEEIYQVKNFERSLAESDYQSLQDELSNIRYKEKGLNNTNMLATRNIVQHETILRQNPVIQEIENKLTENQNQILEYQQKLTAAKTSPAIIRYEELSNEIEGLQSHEKTLVNLIQNGTAQGKDVTTFEEELQQLRKEIEEKQKEREELQPEYDEFEGIENKLEALLKNNTALINQRLALDPEIVKYSQVNTFFNQVVQGTGNNLGIDADATRNKDELSETEEIYDTKSEHCNTFQELLSLNLTLRNSAKSDLSAFQTQREQKELGFLQVNS